MIDAIDEYIGLQQLVLSTICQAQIEVKYDEARLKHKKALWCRASVELVKEVEHLARCAPAAI